MTLVTLEPAPAQAESGPVEFNHEIHPTKDHQPVDLGEMTVLGIVRACPHLSELSKIDPELAESQATRYVNDTQLASETTPKTGEVEAPEELQKSIWETLETEFLPDKNEANSLENEQKVLGNTNKAKIQSSNIDEIALTTDMHAHLGQNIEQEIQHQVNATDEKKNARAALVEELETVDTTHQSYISEQNQAKPKTKTQIKDQIIISEPAKKPTLLDEKIKEASQHGVIESTKSEVQPEITAINETVATMPPPETHGKLGDEKVDESPPIFEHVFEQPKTSVKVYVQLLDIIETENSHNQEQAGEPESFDGFIQRQDVGQPPADLSQVKENAPSQTPEITLAEAVEMLKADTFEPDENQELMTVLEYIEQLFVEAEQTDQDLELTPELTEKLIELFEVLGYEDPSNALIDVAKRRGVIFIVEAAKSLSRSASKIKRLERLLSSVGGGSQSNTPTGLRFSRHLLTLIATVIFLPIKA